MARLELRAKIGLDGTGFQRGMNDVKRSNDFVGKQFDSLRNKLRNMIGAGLIIGAMRGLVRATAGHALEVEELSRKYGLTISEVQNLIRAGEELGITFEEALKKLDPSALQSAITDFSENEIRAIKTVADEWSGFTKLVTKDTAGLTARLIEMFHTGKGIAKGLLTSDWREIMERYYSFETPGLKNPPPPALPFGMGPEFVKPGASLDLMNALGTAQSGTEGTGEGAPLKKMRDSNNDFVTRVNELQRIGAEVAGPGPDRQLAVSIPKLIAAVDKNTNAHEKHMEAWRKMNPGSAALIDAFF